MYLVNDVGDCGAAPVAELRARWSRARGEIEALKLRMAGQEAEIVTLRARLARLEKEQQDAQEYTAARFQGLVNKLNHGITL